MHGKNRLVLISGLLLVGCTNPLTLEEQGKTNIIEVESEIIPNDDYEGPYTLVDGEIKFVSEFTQSTIDEFIKEAAKYEYPDDVVFVPTGLSNDGKLYGQAKSQMDGKTYLGEFDLEKKSFQLIKAVDNDDEFATIEIIIVTSTYVVFEEYNPSTATGKMYVYNFEDGKYSLIREVSELYPLHFNQICETDDGFILSAIEEFGQEYKLYKYTFNDNSMEIIEDLHSGYPVYFNHNLYYLLINREDKKVDLIKYSFETRKKESLYQTIGMEEYISGLYSNGKTLYMTTYDQTNAKWYEVNIQEKQIEYQFTSKHIEAVSYKNNYLKWTGSTEIPNRARLQYFFVDEKNEINYVNEYGDIRLSDTGEVCIVYKKPELEIDKGQVFNNENTYIAYFKFEE